MKRTLRNVLAVMALSLATTAMADDYGRLFIIGDATPGGWSLDMAQALLQTEEGSNVYTGTIFLNNTGEFKFMSVPDWGNLEYGAATDASIEVSGDIKLASGNNDEGYNKMKVATAANYYITVNTEKMTGSVTLSAYQTSEIKYCSLYLVGDATQGGWSVDAGTPLYQLEETPYVYTSKVALKNGSFKIANAVKGGGSFDAQYFIFRDADDNGKISSDGTGDRQWSISEEGDYIVTVNTVDSTISIKKDTSTVLEIISAEDIAPVYYNLQGVRIANPVKGVYIKVAGDKASKIIL